MIAFDVAILAAYICYQNNIFLSLKYDFCQFYIELKATLSQAHLL